MMQKNDTNLVWIDLEYTSLDVEKSHIMQIACIITDKDLNILTDGLEIVVHQSQEIMDGIDTDVISVHKKSGLYDKVLNSKVTLAEAETQMISYIQRFVEVKKSPICGSSVHWDWRMIKKFMPDLGAYMYRRLIDTSTIKELHKRWRPDEPEFVSKHAHTALEDIKESIEELKYYRNIGFVG